MMNKKNLGILITESTVINARTVDINSTVLDSELIKKFGKGFNLDSISMILINPGNKNANQILYQINRELSDIAALINNKGNIMCASILVDVCIHHQYPCILAAHISHLAPITDGILLYHLGEFIPICPSTVPNNNVINHLHTNNLIVCNESRHLDLKSTQLNMT